VHLQQAVPGYTCPADHLAHTSANAVASTTNTVAYRGSDAVDSATDCSTDIGANTIAPAVSNVSALTTTNRNTDVSNDTIPNRPADSNHCVLHGIA
jgi:hypothetical protein